MPKITTVLVSLIVLVGILGLMVGNAYSDRTFFIAYKTIIEIYLFSFTSFLILKRVFFYRVKGNVDVIRLVKRSNYQIPLLFQGLAVTLIYLVYNQLFYDTLSHSNTAIICILLLYYSVQIILDGNPSIYIDQESFSYDDFFVEQWPWQKIRRIELQNHTMQLIADDKDFELDFDEINEIDYIKLNEEVEHNILDGDFAADEASKTLVEIVQTYADLYDVRLINSTGRV